MIKREEDQLLELGMRYPGKRVQIVDHVELRWQHPCTRHGDRAVEGARTAGAPLECHDVMIFATDRSGVDPKVLAALADGVTLTASSLGGDRERLCSPLRGGVVAGPR